MDKHSSILQSFSLQDKLNPEVWNLANESSEIMKPEIRERLLEIAYEFIEFLEIPVFVDDIIFENRDAFYLPKKSVVYCTYGLASLIVTLANLSSVALMI